MSPPVLRGRDQITGPRMFLERDVTRRFNYDKNNLCRDFKGTQSSLRPLTLTRLEDEI